MTVVDAIVTGPGAIELRSDRILEVLRAATLGEYDVATELGRGGMAVVYLAHDLQLNRKVAIKALLPELLFAEGMDRRFKQEARVAAKLDHPNILVIYGVRESRDLLYIVMKLVDGLPLSAVLRRSGAMPIPVAKFIVRQIADALHYAHGEGVIHRDVKPANVMVDRKGNLVVMDFGIAKAVDEAHLTQTGLVIGTPAYMSPEQCLSQRVTFAADQYSLGTVAYELLTGATPFGGSALEMQWAHAKEVAAPIRARRPDCPPELDAMVLRMLSKKPQDRWPTLQQVVDLLPLDSTAENNARQFLQALVAGKPGAPVRSLPTTPISPVPRVSSGGANERLEPPPGEAIPLVPPPVAVTVTPSRLELEEAETADLGAAVDSVEDVQVEWATSDPSVAVVSGTGTVTAISAGIAQVAASVDASTATCDVRVVAARVVAVTVDPNELTLQVGETSGVAVLASSRTGRAIPAKDIRFKSLDRHVARVTDRGSITGHGAGITEIVASVAGIEARVRAVVVPVPVAGIRLDPGSLSLTLGKKAKVIAKPYGAAGNELDTRDVMWTSRDPSIVKVDSGRVVAVGAGSTAIDVACEDIVVEFPVHVTAPAPSIPKETRAPGTRSRPLGRRVAGAIALVAVVGGAFVVRQRVTANADRAGGATQGGQPNDSVTGIVSDADSGRPTNVAVAPAPPAGATRTPVVSPAVDSGGIDSTGPRAVTASTERVAPASIDVLPATVPDLEPGDSIRVAPRVIGSDRRPINDARVTWQSGSTSVATVSSAGWIRATGIGRTTIVVATGGVRRSIPVVVVAPAAARVAIGSVPNRVYAGESIQLQVAVTDKQQVPVAGARVAWRSLQPEIATVDDRGSVSGHGAGRAAIVATSGALADTLSVGVEARPAVVVQPENREAIIPNRSPTSTPKDSAEPPNPVLNQATADGLFRELANAVTSRSNPRIVSIYPEAGSTADSRLQRDFLKFVRDAEPRCVLRTVTLGPPASNGSPLTAMIGCTWRNNAGIPYDRVASFTGTAVSTGTGWTLKDVRLAAKFW